MCDDDETDTASDECAIFRLIDLIDWKIILVTMRDSDGDGDSARRWRRSRGETVARVLEGGTRRRSFERDRVRARGGLGDSFLDSHGGGNRTIRSSIPASVEIGRSIDRSRWREV